MKNSKWLTFLHIGQFLLFYITVSYFFTSTEQLLFIGQYLFFMILFKFLSKRNGFVLLVTYNLLIAIGFLSIAFIEEWQAFRQLQGIANHLVLVLNMSILYGFLYMTKSIEEQNIILKQKVEELTQYVGSSELLTKEEYRRRSILIKTAMKRRGEMGYEIKFLLHERNSYVHRAVFNTLTDLAMETFRDQYDLLGQWNETSFIVLLQNTDEAGMEIALNRYYARIKERLSISEKELTRDIQPIGIVEKEVNTA